LKYTTQDHAALLYKRKLGMFFGRCSRPTARRTVKRMMKSDRAVIAITEGAAPGKRTLTSIMVKLLTENADNRILAVDADRRRA
jgi:pantothenate kinase